MTPEVLAPAGGMEQLVAAVRCGADAVYLGAGGFNARRNAQNFGGGKLREAVAYAHIRGVKIHVTVNTLVMDRELPELDETIRKVAEAGADAAIIQDLGVNARFRELVPALPRHASTQMTVHNLDGAKMAADLGFSRVVLARELTLREIEVIAARCGIETEVFIHGALCMCMSGQCALSSMLGGRSGNRGYCAQPCRLDFKCAGREYALSLKDMSHIRHVKALSEAGVASFKIEGRMKRPEYVAAAVTAVRAALRGEAYDAESLRAVFSRSGFTDGYITGKRDVDMFGYRGKEDVASAAPVLGKLSGLYRSERQTVPVDMDFTADFWGSALGVRCENDGVSVTGPVPEAAINRPLDAAGAQKSLEKTGGTPYFLKSFRADIAPGLTLPASALNAMRREALEKLDRLRAAPTPWPVRDAPLPAPAPHRAGKTALRGRFERYEQVCHGENFEMLVLPLREVEKHPETVEKYGEKLAVELPSLFFDTEKGDLEGRLAKIYALGVKNAVCENLYAIKSAGRLGFTLHGGAGLNAMNSGTLEELSRLGLDSATVSFELSMGRIAALGGEIKRGIIAYGYLPLMRFRVCPVKGRDGCGKCPGQARLTDRLGAGFTVLCHERQFGTLLNSVPLHIAGRQLPELDFLTLCFTVESPEEARRVTEDYLQGRPAPGERTGGLYYRQIL